MATSHNNRTHAPARLARFFGLGGWGFLFPVQVVTPLTVVRTTQTLSDVGCSFSPQNTLFWGLLSSTIFGSFARLSGVQFCTCLVCGKDRRISYGGAWKPCHFS